MGRYHRPPRENRCRTHVGKTTQHGGNPMADDDPNKHDDAAERELVYETTFERGDGDLSEQVIRSVAAVEERPAVDLWPPMYTSVNLDALDRLFAPTAEEDNHRTGIVQFTYSGYEIVANIVTQQIRIYA